MTDAILTTQTQSQDWLRRSIGVLRNGVVISMALASFIPVLLMTLVIVQSPNLGRFFVSRIWAWPVVALLGGAAFGIFIYNLSYRRLDRVLDDYVRVLDRVAEGDLRENLDVSMMDAYTREGQTLIRLGGSINQMLERLRGLIQEIARAMQRLDTDTQAILDATSRQISMANVWPKQRRFLWISLALEPRL
jgi:methyl-accepting chemotaxis protein